MVKEVDGWKGRYFEDFNINDHYKHPFGRTITDADNTWFTLLTMNTNQNHFNSEFAKNSPFGKILVNSGLTVAIVLGQSVIDISQNVFANLGWDKITMPNPVFVGDTLYAESVVLDKRESKSRQYGGIVTAKTRGINQDGKTVIQWKRTFFVYKKDAPQDKEWLSLIHISEPTRRS